MTRTPSGADAFQEDDRQVRVKPADRQKAQLAAELALRYLGVSCKGELDVNNTFDRLGLHGKGWGCGSSTSDVVAAIRAVASAVDTMVKECRGNPPIYVDPIAIRKLRDPRTISLLVFQAEGPCDALAFYPHPIFWLSRNGRVLGPLKSPSSTHPDRSSFYKKFFEFPYTLETEFDIDKASDQGEAASKAVDLFIPKSLRYPRYRCVTFCINSEGVDTSRVQLLNEYTQGEIDEYNMIISKAYDAMHKYSKGTKDGVLGEKSSRVQREAAEDLAAVATRSAELQRQVLRRTRTFPTTLYIEDFLWEWLQQVKHDFGAIGISIAHSGTVVSLLFHPDDDFIEMQRNAARKVREFGFQVVWQYSFGGNVVSEQASSE